VFRDSFLDISFPSFLIDSQGKIIISNKIFQKRYGFGVENVFGENGFISKYMSGDLNPASLFEKLKKNNCLLLNLGMSGEGTAQEMIFLNIYPVCTTKEDGKLMYLCSIQAQPVFGTTDSVLRQVAHYDILTGLPNRILFKERFEQALRNSERNGEHLGIIILDLDRFKRINDTFGHTKSDEILKQVAGRLKQKFRKTDTFARLGGDEFAVVLTDLKNFEDSSIVASNIKDAFQAPFIIGGEKVYMSSSMGICLFPNDGESVEQLMKNADSALYHSKNRGRNCYSYYSGEMNQKANERLGLESRLRDAIKNQEFELYYQPRVNISQCKLVSCEALIRWNDPEKGIIPPLEFIPIAEELGLIVPIGEWVLRTACEDLARWQKMGFTELQVSVNTSAKQFADNTLLDKLEQILEDTGVDSRNLEIEITESTIVKNITMTAKTLEEISNMGVSVAIDDFGTGYSSLNYLKNLPFDTLKIDMEFIRDITNNKNDAAIAKAIIALAQGLNLNVVSEGVETEDQLVHLKKAGCNEVQGFLISRPLTVERFEKFLKDFSVDCKSRKAEMNIS